MSNPTWKIGELAKRTHLTVRALHHYEAIGLLCPSARTEAGHRLYTEADVVRLQRILSLRQLGFALDDIRRCLDQADYALAPLIDLQLARLEAQIALQQRLHRRLGTLRRRLRDGENVPVTHFLETMEAMMKIEEYLTPEQIEKLQAAKRDHPEASMEAFQAFVDQLRGHLEAGHAPDHPELQALLAKRQEAIGKTSLADPALAEGLQRMLRNDDALRARYGLDDALLAFIERATAISRGG